MPVFFSDQTKLYLPSRSHSADDRYTTIEKGKPLSVEILNIAFGNLKDEWFNNKDKSEVLISSWAKKGRSPKPGIRKINVMRKKIDSFEYLQNFGAAEYGTKLIYYTDNLQNNYITITMEMLEIDKIKEENVAKLGNAMKEFSKLAIFAPQLLYFSAAPAILELGRQLYNLLNPNDLYLFEHIDLVLNAIDENYLTSGRYVFVKSSYDQLKFIKNFKLDMDSHCLITTEGNQKAEDVGMKDPYIVIKINGEEISDYKNYEFDAEVQDELQKYVNDGVSNGSSELISKLSRLISNSVKTTIQINSLNEILKLKKRIDSTTMSDKKNEYMKEMKTISKSLNDDQILLIGDVLNINLHE